MTHHIFTPKKEEIAPGTLLGTQPFPTFWQDYHWFQD